jgi:threonine synthase
MSYFTHWRCTQCGEDYSLDEVRYLCPKCGRDYRPGMPLKGVLEAWFDYLSIGVEAEKVNDPADLGMNFLLEYFSPLDMEFYPPIPVGRTPLFYPPRLAGELGMEYLFLKNDGLNPSGSLKDRASQLVVAEANRLGIDEIVCASTGNAASSLACVCAAAGKKAVIFAPAKAPSAKLTQILVHGAELHKVDGTYDDAFAAALSYSETHACLNRNTGYHPFTIEGKKTAGLEIFAQMGTIPDWIVVPVGDGVILAGIHKAFWDLLNAGIISHMPHLLAVQAESSDAITRYWETGNYANAAAPSTIADSISVRTPSNADWSILALQQTEGKAIRVSDQEILSCQKELAAKTGVFAEPSSSATLAGLKAALKKEWIIPEESVVLLITGHGLKDIDAVR